MDLAEIGRQAMKAAVSSSAPRACALAVMAKAPLAGSVKTRLVPPLTPQEAAALNTCFLRDMAETIARVSAGVGRFVAYTPVGAEAAFAGLLPAGFRLLPQRGDDLGHRLLNAAADLLAEGYESLCLINSDSPTLPLAVLNAAIELLAPPGDRVVLGRSDDGGYYLIGLKDAHPHLFERIAWSTGEVLADTVERAARLRLEVKLLPAWYDVDDEASLRRLCEELLPSASAREAEGGLRGDDAPHTREYLERLLRGGKLNGAGRDRTGAR